MKYTNKSRNTNLHSNRPIDENVIDDRSHRGDSHYIFHLKDSQSSTISLLNLKIQQPSHLSMREGEHLSLTDSADR